MKHYYEKEEKNNLKKRLDIVEPELARLKEDIDRHLR